MHGHLVPGLVHLAAVDALDREHVEDDRVEVDRDLARRDPEQRDAAAVRHVVDDRRAARPRCPTSRARRRSPPSCRARAARRARSRLARVDAPASRPCRCASSSRYGFRSVTTTWRAPAWRTTAAAMQPIGPAPVMSTSSPSTGNASAVCTAFPNGSKIAATSSSTPGQWCQMFVIGSATSSANAPGRLTPSPIVCAHRCRRPAMQLRQRPQTTWPSPQTTSPGVEVAHVRADVDDLADELVPDHHRHRDRLLRPVVPAVDVQVGAADPRLADADQDVVDADLRLRDVLEPEARLGVRLDERLHRRAIVVARWRSPVSATATGLHPR